MLHLNNKDWAEYLDIKEQTKIYSITTIWKVDIVIITSDKPDRNARSIIRVKMGDITIFKLIPIQIKP